MQTANSPWWFEIAKLILEYLKVLVWPSVAVWVAFRYRKHLDRLFERITSETEEVEAKFLGLSAKFRKQIAEIAEVTTAGAARSEHPVPAALALEQVRLLADVFFSKPLKERQAGAREVQQLSPLLRLSDILALVDSPLPGERVAAGIALHEHIRKVPALGQQPDIIAAVTRGLADPLSRVRYRFVRAAAASPAMRQALRGVLETIAAEDSDAVVRQEASNTVQAG